jgi:bile acid:Na+ symporter, BASS family
MIKVEIKNKYHVMLLLACTLFVLSIVSFVLKKLNVASPFLILSFVLTCLAMRGFPKVRGYIYTMWIFTALILALSYPNHFQSYNEYKFSGLIPPLLQIIMFGMGSQMSLKDFSGVLKMPKGVLIGLLCHYSLMPFIGYTITQIFGFPKEIAVGIILVACTPSGMASNVMVFLGKGNLALAITVTAFSTMISPLLTPFLLKFIAGHMVHIDIVEMMIEIIKMVIFPIIAGLSFNSFYFGRTNRKSLFWQMSVFFLIIILKNLILFQFLDITLSLSIKSLIIDLMIFFILPPIAGILFNYFTKANNVLLTKILTFLSQLGLIIITVIIVANGYDTLLSKWGLLLVPAMLLHNCLGYFSGYWFCRLFKMKEQDCRALTFEVGMQNGGMASAMAVKVQGMELSAKLVSNPEIKPSELAMIGVGFAVPAAVFSPIQNITGSVLAMWFRNRINKDELENKNEL